MDYGLAKKLKDAGFPQGGESVLRVLKFEGKIKVYIPTLSELIEACGDRLHVLWQDRDSNSWEASEQWDHACQWHDDDYAQGEGSTPEEAVAGLWLEINKK